MEKDRDVREKFWENKGAIVRLEGAADLNQVEDV